MRLRGKPWAEQELAENSQHAAVPSQHKGRWNEKFGNNNKIHLEIGCGKGGFIVKTALANPHINFIAMERAPKIIVMALKLSRESGSPANLLFINGDARLLNEYFEDGELERMYINFCDPWRNRGKWHKRRLTYRAYLASYERLMNGASVFFKTDDAELFQFSLHEFEETGWEFKNVTFDLHNSGYEGNIMTEYEERFYNKGMVTHRLEAYKTDASTR